MTNLPGLTVKYLNIDLFLLLELPSGKTMCEFKNSYFLLIDIPDSVKKYIDRSGYSQLLLKLGWSGMGYATAKVLLSKGNYCISCLK